MVLTTTTRQTLPQQDGTGVKSMFSNSGDHSEYSNHSPRASGATELSQAEVPEKVIHEITGHRSVKALCQYEKVSDVKKSSL